MQATTLLIVVIVLSAVAYQLGRRRSLAIAGSAGPGQRLHSLPSYYGMLTAIWCGIPALLLVAVWVSAESTVIMPCC